MTKFNKLLVGIVALAVLYCIYTMPIYSFTVSTNEEGTEAIAESYKFLDYAKGNITEVLIPGFKVDGIMQNRDALSVLFVNIVFILLIGVPVLCFIFLALKGVLGSLVNKKIAAGAEIFFIILCMIVVFGGQVYFKRMFDFETNTNLFLKTSAQLFETVTFTYVIYIVAGGGVLAAIFANVANNHYISNKERRAQNRANRHYR